MWNLALGELTKLANTQTSLPISIALQTWESIAWQEEYMIVSYLLQVSVYLLAGKTEARIWPPIAPLFDCPIIPQLHIAPFI